MRSCLAGRRSNHLYWSKKAYCSFLFADAVSKSPGDDPCLRADKIFAEIDINGDGELNEEEFLTGCLRDDELMILLEKLFTVLSSGFEK